MVKIESIAIKRVEGKSMQSTVLTWENAEKYIMSMAMTAPSKGEGYDKSEFLITWENGQTYKGRVDLQREMSHGYDLKEHIKGAIAFMIKNKFVDESEAVKFINDCIN